MGGTEGSRETGRVSYVQATSRRTSAHVRWHVLACVGILAKGVQGTHRSPHLRCLTGAVAAAARPLPDETRHGRGPYVPGPILLRGTDGDVCAPCSRFRLFLRIFQGVESPTNVSSEMWRRSIHLYAQFLRNVFLAFQFTLVLVWLVCGSQTLHGVLDANKDQS